MKPLLPRKISRNVSQITPASWNALIACLEYAMDHPRGDGATILNGGDGILRAAAARRASGFIQAAAYRGPFSVIIEGNAIQVVDAGNPQGGLAGQIRVGFRTFDVPAAELPLQLGHVYAWVRATLDAETDLYVLTAGIGMALSIPSEARLWTYRIAQVYGSENDYRSQQIWAGGDITVEGRWV